MIKALIIGKDFSRHNCADDRIYGSKLYLSLNIFKEALFTILFSNLDIFRFNLSLN